MLRTPQHFPNVHSVHEKKEKHHLVHPTQTQERPDTCPDAGHSPQQLHCGGEVDESMVRTFPLAAHLFSTNSLCLLH